VIVGLEDDHDMCYEDMFTIYWRQDKWKPRKFYPISNGYFTLTEFMTILFTDINRLLIS